MKSQTTIQWTKCPSVYRPNVPFYTVAIEGTRYWIKRGNRLNSWYVSDDCGGAWGNFRTAKEAMKAVEAMD